MAALLTVVAEMKAKPARKRSAPRVLALIEPTRREDGCAQYDLHVHTEDPGRFLFYENWLRRSTSSGTPRPPISALREDGR